MYDVIIIGAGPAGCRTAELLAKSKKKVLVIEEHTKIGEPVQCTGLISGKLLEIHPDLPKNIILNKIKTARFFAPSGTNFSLSVKKPALVVDRAKLDKWIYSKAKQAGAEFKLGMQFKGFQKKSNNLIIKTNNGNFETHILIGADGPLSRVRKLAKIKADYTQQIFSQKTIVFGGAKRGRLLQGHRPGEGKFGDSADLCFGGEYFNWFVPISKTKARFGGPSKEMKFKGESGGVCRYGLLKTAQKGNIYLVGDAALQVKPFSCGGVVYGQIAARCLAKAIIEDRDYDELWKAKLAWPIRKGLLLCQFYTFPNWLKSLLFEIIVRTCSEKLLENLDMDFY
ncbi:NAD(P)/FAD-dependent oxidoreductase [Candidatus Woesearchaeota archaeon]|jgi:digeranylgeranylglycerophospholipid reductase|nr:NAD(P)/FAD-dependent oxidoreductase [Candidatus Woesearchaeota archaeon]MBT7062843.1 NAD(P)/FAD-dependent oxidoreductase [Candidatus Woesearchaeota archaeon]MBT7403008.1 NAD(P)/FAD-dependent oxidoreductase [Candidatus Woesearchaeota archaeon]